MIKSRFDLQNNLSNTLPQKWLLPLLLINALVFGGYAVIGWQQMSDQIFDNLLMTGYAVLAVGLLLFSVQKPQQFATGLKTWRTTPPFWFDWFVLVVVVWMGILSFGLALGQVADDPFILVPLYIWALVLGIGLGLFRSHDPSSTNTGLSGRKRFVLGGVFATLSVLRDSVILWAFSYLYSYDSISYLYSLDEFLDPQHPTALKRSIPYPLMNLLVDSVNDPWRILYFQVVLGAVALGVLVYMLAGRSWLWAVFVGVLISLDMSWATANRAILTEGVFISFHVISLAWMMRHYVRHESVQWWEFLLAGLFFGWTVIIRPSGVLLAVPIALGYLIFAGKGHHRWRAGALVTVGMVTVIFSSALFNQIRADQFGISGETGVYVAFPLFDHGLFDPQNGETSAQLDRDLRSCFENPEYDQINSATANEYIHNRYRPCLNGISPLGREYESAMYGGAYREAVLNDPLGFLKIVVREMGSIISFDVQSNLYEIGYERRPSISCRETFEEYPWCEDLPTAFRVMPWDARAVAVKQATTYPIQPYFLMLPPEFHRAEFPDEPMSFHAYDTLGTDSGSLASLAAALMLFIFLMATTTASERFVILAATLFIIYSALSIAAGHIFLPRYARPLSPFYAMLAGTLFFVLIRAGVKIPSLEGRGLYFVGVPMIIMGLLLSGYLLSESRAEAPYLSITRQAEMHLETLETDMIYNPTPYHPDQWAAKWLRPQDFIDTELSETAQSRLYDWAENPIPDYLTNIGIHYLIFDQVWWNNQSEQAQAIIQTTQNYQLVREWHDVDTGQSIWLYKITNPTLAPIYASEVLQIFEQADGQLDLYGIADGNGFFIMRVDPKTFNDSEHTIESETGWRADWAENESGYVLRLFAPDGTLQDDGFLLEN